MEWPVGGLIEGRYEVFDIKAQSLGIVYICYDHQTRDPVVIKTFPDSLLSHEQSRARFVANAQAWRGLGAHRHVVQALDVRDIEGKPHVLVEFIEPSEAGHTLRWRLRAGHVPIPEAVEILLAVCRAFMHATDTSPGFTHGDLRPENIMITRDGTVKVTDFGMLISLVDPTAIDILQMATDGPVDSAIMLSEGGIPLCSLPYIAPERLSRAQPPTPSSDLYALGCVGYELLTHRWLFDAETAAEFLHAHIGHDPVPICDAIGDVPQGLQGVVMRCLAKDPADRYGSFAELHDALEGAWRTALGAPHPVEVMDPSVEVAPTPVEEPAEPVADEAVSEPEPVIGEPPLSSAPEPVLEPEVEPEPEPQPEPAAAEQPEEAEPEPIAEEEPAAPPAAQSVDALLEEALQAARGGEMELAIKLWQDALREDWHTPSAHANLGAALAARGDVKRAHTHLREAVRLAPKRPQAHFNIGRLYHDQGELDRAVESFEAALALDPDYAVAYVALGATLEALGEVGRAAEAYREAVTRSDNATAKARLAALEGPSE